MERTHIGKLGEHVGKEVLLKAWVDVRRDQGKMVFLDLRDVSGKVQAVALPMHKEALDAAQTVRPEWVLAVSGNVNKRPEKNIKQGVVNGDIELEILSIEVLNEAETPAFDIASDGREINEEVRLSKKYIDLRRPRMQRNIKERHRIIKFLRDRLDEEGFYEIETPLLTAPTPEGSRSYLVPSRIWKGTFYALPQSPQQYKQLLMSAGFERYFQFAKCMRDEDTRGDRQPEFTQLDFEMSFVEQEDVLSYTEEMFIKLVQSLYPEKTITQVPFPRLTYAESMERYGSDKPDLRVNKEDPNELAFAWVVDFPMFEKLEDGTLQAAHHPFCSVKPEDREKFLAGEDLFSIRANAYDLVLNGYELSSGSIRIHNAKEQEQVFTLLGMSDEERDAKFGHILEAFTFGTPPHGGFAPGIDRIVMLLENQPNIREVIAFAKTGEGKDLMTGAPSYASDRQLKELGIQIPKKEK